VTASEPDLQEPHAGRRAEILQLSGHFGHNATAIKQNARMTNEAGSSAATALDGPGVYERPVAGTVRLMTEEPLEMPRNGRAEGIREQLSLIVNRRPWLVPAVLLGAGVAYLLVRRRR
jgi:hypothetical protein